MFQGLKGFRRAAKWWQYFWIFWISTINETGYIYPFQKTIWYVDRCTYLFTKSVPLYIGYHDNSVLHFLINSTTLIKWSASCLFLMNMTCLWGNLFLLCPHFMQGGQIPKQHLKQSYHRVFVLLKPDCQKWTILMIKTHNFFETK